MGGQEKLHQHRPRIIANNGVQTFCALGAIYSTKTAKTERKARDPLKILPSGRIFVHRNKGSHHIRFSKGERKLWLFPDLERGVHDGVGANSAAWCVEQKQSQ